MSEHIKRKWQLLYYAQVMAMLDHVKNGGKEICGVTPKEAGHLMNVLFKYGYIDLYDYDSDSKLSPETIVRVNLFADELTDIDTLWGFMLANGLESFVPPFDLDNEYVRAMVQKAEDYVKAQNEKRDACLQAIRDYVAECESAGRKPVKKRVAERTGLNYSFVCDIWQVFDQERNG